VAVTVQRSDFETIQGVETTPQGGRRMASALTRVGVFKYRDASGRQWSELRPPEEVFAEDSLATLRSAPVVDLHPAGGRVTTENFKELALGHVHDDVRPQGDLVVATTTVNDAEACARIDRGERAETWCGYRCDLDPTTGEWRGERYDQVQRNIRYNHLGIGPKGWARGGGEMALLRCDGAASEALPGALAEPSGPGVEPPWGLVDPSGSVPGFRCRVGFPVARSSSAPASAPGTTSRASRPPPSSSPGTTSAAAPSTSSAATAWAATDYVGGTVVSDGVR